MIVPALGPMRELCQETERVKIPGAISSFGPIRDNFKTAVKGLVYPHGQR